MIASTGTTGRPAVGPTRAPRAPSVVEETLGRGLHAIVARRGGVPMVDLRLGFLLGADVIAKPAAAMVLSESILAGTDRHDRAGLASAVQRIGGYLTASVAGDWMSISASVLSEHLPEMLALVGEVLAGATYPGHEVGADRDRMADQVLIALSQPDVIADEELAPAAASRSPVRLRAPEPRGVATSGRGAAAEPPRRDLRAGPGPLRDGRRRDAPQGARRGVERLRAVARTGRGRRRCAARPAAPGAPRPAAAVRPSGRGPEQHPHRPRRSRPAPTPGGRRRRSRNLIFGGMFASRLVENLRERNGYTYSPRTSFDHGRAGSSFVIHADVATESTAASLLETRYELGRIAIQGVTADELESARRYALGALLFETATQSGLASSLVRFAVMGLDPGYLSRYAIALKRAKLRDVDEAAGRLLAPSQMVTVVVGDAGLVGGSLALVGEVEARPVTVHR